jgi:chloramphenicol 3-O phosphotransferase
MIFYINGASSSGKSTIALALQKLIRTPVLYFSTDRIIQSLPTSVTDAIHGNSRYEVSVDWSSLFKGYFDCVLALSKANNIVIADCPIYSEGTYKLYQDSIGSYTRKIVVGLKCDLETLQNREKTRSDRDPGLAAMQFKEIHNFMKYDLMVDSQLHSADEIAHLILNMDASPLSNK